MTLQVKKDIAIGYIVLLKNETGHKLDFKYTGSYKVEIIQENGT